MPGNSQTAAVSEFLVSPIPLESPDIEPVFPVLDELPGAVLVLDEVGTILFMNRIAEHRLDQSQELAAGRNLFTDVLPELNRAGDGERYRAALRTGPGSVAWTASIGVGKEQRTIEFGARGIETNAGKRGLVVLEDRTQLRAETDRRKRAERLASVGELAAGAAHEINNPLASIKGFAQLLSRETLDRGQQQALEIISQECNRVARIVDNLLEFATQQSASDLERFDISGVVKSVLSLKRYALETSGIRIDADLEQNLSQIEGEKGALQRLVLILVSHAERSLDRAESERVLTVRTRETNDGVVLYVSDNGPGVPRHTLSRLLEDDQAPQNALSLNSAQMIAYDHGGTLWIESGEGKGSTVTVRLPRAAASSDAAQENENRPEAQSVEVVSASRPVRVLVADDEPTLRLALSMFLSRHGYEVEQAEDVAQALRLVANDDFDVAMIDVRMPGDGLVLIDRLDDDTKWSGRTILMTGDQTISRVKDEISSGRPHLIKPFDMMEAVRLVERISSVIANPTDKPLWTSS